MGQISNYKNLFSMARTESHRTLNIFDGNRIYPTMNESISNMKAYSYSLYDISMRHNYYYGVEGLADNIEVYDIMENNCQVGKEIFMYNKFSRICNNNTVQVLDDYTYDPLSFLTPYWDKETRRKLNIKRRRENENMINYIRSNNIIPNIISRVTNHVSEVVLSDIKNLFGNDYSITANMFGEYVISRIEYEFIAKYDKKFKARSNSDCGDDKHHLTNTEFIVKFDNHTFMYVAVGSKVPKINNLIDMFEIVSKFDLYIYIFGRNYKKYYKELMRLVKKIHNDNEIGIYTVNSSGDARDYKKDSGQCHESLYVYFDKLHYRDMNTLFYSYEEKETICDHIDKFISNESFYADRQITYKTGILLYGCPGTGKSSLVKALSTKYNRSIININISNLAYIDLNALTQSINADTDKRYIILFEDIDTLFLKRDDNSDKESRSIINKLLQFLDSNTSPINVIFIATTNHIERLDDALLREGRFDLKVEVNELLEHEATQFGLSFGLTYDKISEILMDMDLNNTGLKSRRYNQAKLQARILAKIENKTVEKAMDMYASAIEKDSNNNLEYIESDD